MHREGRVENGAQNYWHPYVSYNELAALRLTSYKLE